MALFFYFLAGSTRVNAEPETVLSVSPPAATVGQGEAFTVEIDVADAVDLYGFALRVSFDPACLQVDESQPDPLELGGFLVPGGMNIKNEFDDPPGVVQFHYAQVNPAEPRTGEGTLLVIHLIARRVNCTSAIIIETAGSEPTILTDRNGFSLPYQAENGSVEITGVSFRKRLYLPLIIYPESDN